MGGAMLPFGYRFWFFCEKMTTMPFANAIMFFKPSNLIALFVNIKSLINLTKGS
jgi:hypothetical protein